VIYVECSPDLALIRKLGVPRREIRHSSGKGEVLKRVLRGPSIGLVDEDPESPQPRRLEEFELERDLGHLRVLRSKKGMSYLVIICPVLEAWVLNAARSAGVNMGRLGLPSDWRELHKVINARRVQDRFERLLDEINQSREFKELRSVILELRRALREVSGGSRNSN